MSALCHYAGICGGNVLEIGCNEGNTTAVLALNNPDRLIIGVDFDQSATVMIAEQHYEQPDVVGKHAHDLHNVRILNIDSSRLDYDEAWNVKLVFIDGGHHYRQVKVDSEKAIEYLSRTGGGTIIWHDYGPRPAWVGVTQYVDEEIDPRFQTCRLRGTSLALAHV
jgi:predicted O-methyltransferase YrrM